MLTNYRDLHVLEGDFPGVRMPVVAGHEGAGVVVRGLYSLLAAEYMLTRSKLDRVSMLYL